MKRSKLTMASAGVAGVALMLSGVAASVAVAEDGGHDTPSTSSTTASGETSSSSETESTSETNGHATSESASETGSEGTSETDATSDASQSESESSSESATDGAEGNGKVTRSGGDNRYQTAVFLSQKYFKDASKVKTVYVASGKKFPDALAASAVAASKNVPVLLVEGDKIPAEVKAELKRLDPKNVVLMGGPGAITESVSDEVAKMVGKDGVVRVNGLNRFDTAAKLAATSGDERGGADVVFLADGLKFPDALTSSAVAGAGDDVILLTESNKLAPETEKALKEIKPKTVVAVGGEAAVSDSVAKQAAEAAGVESGKFVRLGGANRFRTAQAVAEYAPTGTAKHDFAVVSNGLNFPDALVGAAVAGSKDGVVVLTEANKLSPEASEILKKFTPAHAVVTGGEAVVTPKVMKDIEGLLNK